MVVNLAAESGRRGRVKKQLGKQWYGSFLPAWRVVMKTILNWIVAFVGAIAGSIIQLCSAGGRPKLASREGLLYG